MRKTKVVYLLASLIAGVAMIVSAAAQTVIASQSQIQHLLDQEQAAWNSNDSAAWGSTFTDDADFVNILGAAYHGRAAIVELHKRILSAPFLGSHATITIRQFTEITPGVALVETVHEVTGYKFLPPGIVPTTDSVLETRMKYVAVKRGQQWLFLAAQNTAILPAAAMPPH